MSNVNLMGAKNLATVFGPNMLKSPAEKAASENGEVNAVAELGDMGYKNAVIENMILFGKKIFAAADALRLDPSADIAQYVNDEQEPQVLPQQSPETDPKSPISNASSSSPGSNRAGGAGKLSTYSAANRKESSMAATVALAHMMKHSNSTDTTHVPNYEANSYALVSQEEEVPSVESSFNPAARNPLEEAARRPQSKYDEFAASFIKQVNRTSKLSSVTYPEDVNMPTTPISNNASPFSQYGSQQQQQQQQSSQQQQQQHPTGDHIHYS
ncbi:hypothetical protein MIR68_002294 [Amoeboaphelidium protococcarum]|nr:hypothetical protein MIR68_002294 [Amoeboaphelidium protococcarum]